MSQNISLWGANYSAVPAVDLPKQGGGLARFTDVSPTDAVESDVASGKIFFKADGSQATGTASGGGSSKNAQDAQSTTRTTSTSYTKLSGEITVSKTGTYDVYWSGVRSSTSGTWGTQLYIDGTAYGSAQSSYSNHVQNVHLSNVSLTQGEKISVYGRSRGSNYYAYVPQLTIIEA